MKSVYPNSTSSRAANCRFSWESAVAGVEYLFMGDERRNQGQITDGNHDFRFQRISGLNIALKPNQASGRYRYQDAVPI
ncbi:hypothetical protein OGM63_09090 [Plectonema radiosum NIES-515]|uniref:Uncharacterized protein n=1 Tax=Plectonema radiosum NIES-515 TaxID=2986073 RepID=A0ABT3AX67_9CYAN|nr:hypothetical protein [Plectonema radiosum]MCV3213680.1 hypothetical protein [Plectonema radiosum NIES-515]